MATTAFSRSHASTVDIWRARLFKQAQQQTYFGKFSGGSDQSMIQVIDDLEHQAGDKIRYDLLMNLTGEGVLGDTLMEGNEESLVYHQDSVIINQRSNGVRSAGKMTDKRTRHNIRSNARTALGNWMGQIIDTDMVLALAGLANQAGQTTAAEPDSGHRFIGGEIANGGTLTVETTGDSALLAAEHLMGTEVIEQCKRQAQLLDVKLRPLLIEGGQFYVMFMHPYQAKALKKTSAWKNAHYYNDPRSMKASIFRGSLGIWDGVILHEYDKIPKRLGASGESTVGIHAFDSGDPLANTVSACRALFCGAQAGVIAYGQHPGWHEKDFDYGRVPGIMTDVIYGIKKTIFNSLDFGVITVDTAVILDSPSSDS